LPKILKTLRLRGGLDKAGKIGVESNLESGVSVVGYVAVGGGGEEVEEGLVDGAAGIETIRSVLGWWW